MVVAPDGSKMKTVVAIDKDKNSQQAVKWTVDHLLFNDHTVVLLHVRRFSANNHYGFVMVETTRDAAAEQFESEMAQMFIPYRAFCGRKGVQVLEVVLEDREISKAIIDYITINNIHNVVLGASSRNAITRTFRQSDVPSNVMKSAPDFCAVYVISKGKPVTVRSAKGPAPTNPVAQRQTQAGIAAATSSVSDSDDTVKTQFVRGNWRGATPSAQIPDRRSFEKTDHMRPSTRERLPSSANRTPGHALHVSLDIYCPPRASASRDSFSDDFDAQRNFRETLEMNMSMNNTSHASSPQATANRNMAAEVKWLKLELKQTMDMYSTARNEVITSKQKTMELQEWKMEETRRVEEARNAEEAALALVEVEKAKRNAAVETAQAAQRLAGQEAQKRQHAELKAKREAEEKMRALNAMAHNEQRYRKYSIDDIELATEYFSDLLKIGEGGYGPVYRASLDHTPVAIKVLRPDAAQGKKQFQQEVEVLSRIRHPNMVLLLGACPEYGCLVYELMNNGSLEDRLYRRGDTPSIPWPIRFRIAAEIATGLQFLHQAKPEPFVHRDLKPANILLDHNYTSKISDVGLSRLVPPSVANRVTQYRMTSTAGTFCYIDPEYQQTGLLGTKSDVYSFGVLLLQIITAKAPMGLTHHVERALERGTFPEMLDRTVPNWPVEDVVGLARLALKCSELRKKDRPDLGTVVLPELNRLRNLGLAYEANRSSADAGSEAAHRRAKSIGFPTAE